jgi:hypothetical protein
MRVLAERFWEKVDREGPLNDDGTRCWLWTASTLPKGYGKFSVGGKYGGWAYAHRVAYELMRGPIEEFLDHRYTCPKNCVNPDHLRPATKKQDAENLTGPYSTNKCGVRGVCWTKGKWQVVVKHHGKNYYGGRFIVLAEAEAAAIALRNRLFTHNDLDRR